MLHLLPGLSGRASLSALGALLALFLAQEAHAQDENTRRQHALVLDKDTVLLDTLSLAPGSFTLLRNGVPVDPSTYALDTWHGRLIRKNGAPTDTVIASYRVLPTLLAGPIRHKSTDVFRPLNEARPDPFRYVPGGAPQDPLGISGLNKSGSISRGILFGNNQDLSVNSALNLELSGKLTESISVLASVTDNNIPIQAGGNTAELQDFDRVFVKLFDDRQELVAGDFVLQRPKSHFITYLKKTKGLSYSTLIGRDSTRSGTVGVAAAISKGKFARDVVQGVEGVQGPYRLTADDGGTFLIILSGTERVYIDGQLMSRGQENDYVIDYNTAQITFTAKRLITKDRRIVVEFQYSDKNYARSLTRLTSDWTLGRTALHANVYTEQDHKNQPLQQSLTDDEKRLLSEAGDDPLKAVAPGVDSVAYSTDEVLYARIDSLGYFPVYRNSTNDTLAHFRVSFSNVGAGNGDYVQDSFTPLGRVFRWVAPEFVGGALVHKGDYAPVRLLVAPRAQQIISLGAEHRFGTRTTAWSELAWSNDDRNTFSTLDNGDDQGQALRAGLNHAFPLSASDTSAQLIIGTDNEWLSRTFKPVERFRPVEFERNWNLPTGVTGTTAAIPAGDQLLSTVSLGIRATKLGSARLSSTLFRIEDGYLGFRQLLETDLHPGTYELQGSGSLLNTEANALRTDFVRYKARLAKHFKRFTLGVLNEHERNHFRNDTTQSLEAGSYAFFDWEGFIQNSDTSARTFRLGAGQRYEQALRDGLLVRSTEATTYNAAFKLSGKVLRKLGASFTYRQLRIIDTLVTVQKPEDTWLARLDLGLTGLKGVISGDVFYEFGSGLEQKREFIYVQVPPGQGTHVWIDYNGNGIKELNEFEVAQFGYEADYLRVYTPTNEFVRTYSNQLSASAELRPMAVWGEAKGFKRFVAKWSDMASFRSDRKTGTADLDKALDPFRVDPSDTSLTAFSSSLRNTIYYDRSSPKWSMDHTRQSDRIKSLLTNGFESRVRESDLVHVRWNTTSQWTLEVEGSLGRVRNASDLLSGRTYSIEDRSTKPKISWQPNTRMRASAQFKYTEKRNRPELGGERAEVRDAGLEFRYNTTGKGSLQLNGNLVGIDYNGTVSSSLGNEMLGGLKPGNNVTWGATIQRRLSDHLQVDLTYNGRSSEGTPVVHVGGAQVRAFF